MSDEALKPRQGDRDAAADYMLAVSLLQGRDPTRAHALFKTDQCDELPIVQAFARHAATARLEAMEEAARLCDAEAAERKRRHESGDPNYGDSMAQAHKMVTADHLAAAIRSLPAPSSGDDVEGRARELLAAEYERDGYKLAAQYRRDPAYTFPGEQRALRAIVRALSRGGDR